MDNNCLMMTVNEFLENKEHEYIIHDDSGNSITIKLPKDRTYSIPAYQREIRWQAENVNFLIDDLSNGKKFLGTILLNKVNDNNYEIIDGQQRTSVFVLILHAISKINLSTYNLCGFFNKTYEKLFEVMNLDFKVDKINESPEKETYINSDVLEQRERFEKIWKAINDKLKVLNPEKLEQFKDNLLYSEINIIFAQNRNKRILVDYYLDLNDKSVKLDNIDILKANLFKVNYDAMAEKWADVQKSIKDFRISGLNYALPTYYYHYFACSINKYLNYKLKNLKTNMKFSSSVKIDGHHYDQGMDVLRAVKDHSFFEKAIKELKETAVFLKNVFENDGLTAIKQKMRVAGCDTVTIDNVLSIINAILRIDDEVPKILIMKYFLDVLNQERLNKSNVKIIYDIYVYSILFAVTTVKKESSKLVRIVMSKEWMKKIKDQTADLYTNYKDKINYYKVITVNGKVTETSGQYIPKHIIAIKEFAKIKSKAIKFNEQKLNEYLLSRSCTAEHFFINKSTTVSFSYGSEGAISRITLPKNITKYISCPVNYIYLDSSVNEEIGNKTIKEKIELLTTKKASAFSTKKNYKYFLMAKEAFDEIGNFPDLKLETNQLSAEIAVRDYYNEHLVDLMNKYIEKISTI